jgi:hypothetical protein
MGILLPPFHIGHGLKPDRFNFGDLHSYELAANAKTFSARRPQLLRVTFGEALGWAGMAELFSISPLPERWSTT